MRKIVIITDVWHPQVNGVMTILEKIIGLLKQNDFSVTVIHPGLFFTVPMPFYPEIKMPLMTRNKIRKILKKENPDYVHIVTEGLLGFAGRAVCMKAGLKFTTSYHTHFPHYIKLRVGALFNATYGYLRWFHNAGERVMVCSESLKNELESRGFKRVAMWPYGVDTNLFTKNTRAHVPEYLINIDEPIFFYLGRIATEKDVEEFLKCSLPGKKIVIGDGPDRKKLEKKYGKDFHFVGCVRGQELVDLISLCDVMVFPSKTDTFGLTIIESMSCGLPVAAHKVMGPVDIITQGVDGYMDEDLSKAALACVGLSADSCRKKALTYSWETSLEMFILGLVKVK